MYDATDPRSTLSVSGNAAMLEPARSYAGAELIEFGGAPPSGEAGSKTWYGRGQNFVLSFTEAEEGVILSRHDQPDEYMVFLPQEEVVIDIETDAGAAVDVRYKLAIIPPGDSKITVKKGGRVIRLFGAGAPDLLAKSFNATSYEQPHPNIAPFKPWPSPSDGFKLRVYPMDPPMIPGSFGRIYRSTNLMVNLFEVSTEIRDPNKVSPHHHDDFEQCSLTLQGTCVHHLRWPWTPDIRIWREDEHLHCVAPAMTVIPPLTIHTTQSLTPPNQGVDIFAPPRMDFSKAGWVLNADDYPMP